MYVQNIYEFSDRAPDLTHVSMAALIRGISSELAGPQKWIRLC